MRRHLIEVGFMGVGKSTVGKEAARVLSLPFYDTDKRVEELDGRKPSVIIDRDGEPEFRKIEREALASVLSEEPGIVATGGGIVSTELGRKALLNCEGRVVWLQLDFETTKSRVEADTENNRPLFKVPAKALELYSVRQEWYDEVSSVTLDASRPVAVVADDIVRLIA